MTKTPASRRGFCSESDLSQSKAHCYSSSFLVRTYIAVIRNSAAPATAKIPPISASPVCGELLEFFGAVVVVDALVVAFVVAAVVTVVTGVVVVSTVVVVVVSTVVVVVVSTVVASVDVVECWLL